MEEYEIGAYNVGHPMTLIDGEWYIIHPEKGLIDNSIENYMELVCPRCGLKPTKDGHDPCIANLPDVDYACCGHGIEEERFEQAYISYSNGEVIRFKTTDDLLKHIKK